MDFVRVRSKAAQLSQSVAAVLALGSADTHKERPVHTGIGPMAASSRGGKLSLISSVRDYVSRMASDVSGMKVLVLDAETTGIVSMVYTQTQILQARDASLENISTQWAPFLFHRARASLSRAHS